MTEDDSEILSFHDHLLHCIMYIEGFSSRDAECRQQEPHYAQQPQSAIAYNDTYVCPLNKISFCFMLIKFFVFGSW